MVKKLCISIHRLRHFPEEVNLKRKRYLDGCKSVYGTGTIDKLWIYTSYINDEYIRRNWIFDNEGGDKNYARTRKFHHKSTPNAFIYISTNFKEIYPFFESEKGLYEHRIILNPTDFGSMKKVLRFLDKIMDYRNKEHRHVIGRIDFSVLLPEKIYSIQALHESIYIPRKRLTTLYNSDQATHDVGTLSGFSIGTGDERLNTYSLDQNLKKAEHYKKRSENMDNSDKKRYQKFEHYSSKAEMSSSGRHTINIEMQVKRKYLCERYNIRSLIDLEKRIKINPFAHIQLKDVYRANLDDQKMSDLILATKKMGFQGARIFLNKRYSKNFLRDFGRLPSLVVNIDHMPTVRQVIGESFARGMNNLYKN